MRGRRNKAAVAERCSSSPPVERKAGVQNNNRPVTHSNLVETVLAVDCFAAVSIKAFHAFRFVVTIINHAYMDVVPQCKEAPSFFLCVSLCLRHRCDNTVYLEDSLCMFFLYFLYFA
jgi:hypothetical protein